jgi:hypothetical protein
VSLRMIAVMVRVLLALFAAGMVYEIGHVVWTGGVNAGGTFGERSLVCVPAPPPGGVAGNIVEDPARLKALGAVDDRPYPVHSGVEFYGRFTEICREDASFLGQLVYQSTRLATPLALLVALVLLERLIAAARRGGGFDGSVGGGLTFLCLFLVLAPMATTLFTTIVQANLAVSMAAGAMKGIWVQVYQERTVPWAYLIAGIGLVVMAGVVRVGARMREDLEGTV